jgi:predicted kinase
VDATEKTYGHLVNLTKIIIQAGYPAIVDATFLKRRHRTAFRELAAALNVPFVILDFAVPEAVLRARILARFQEGIDPSEANLEVLEHQLATQEPLTADEAARILTINTFPST